MPSCHLARLCALAVLALTAACSKPEAKWTYTIKDAHTEELCRDIGAPMGAQAIYCGPIDESFLTFLNQSLAPHQTELVLTSQGGLIEHAMEARRILDAKGIKLTLRRLCISACAMYIFLPDKNPTVEPDTLVAFHGSATGLKAMVKNAPGRESSIWWPNMVEIEKEERAFFKSYGLDENWLMEGDMRNYPRCLARIEMGDTPAPRFGFVRQTDYWTPTRGMIEKFSPMKLEGFWPVQGADTASDAAEINRLLASAAIAPQKLRIAVGGYEKFHPEKWGMIQDIPLCKDVPAQTP